MQPRRPAKTGRPGVEEASSPVDELEMLLDRGAALLAQRRATEATGAFTDAYTAAVAAGRQSSAARAMLGRAQGEFAAGRLASAASHAQAAWHLFTVIASPQAKHATDLMAQIEHYRYLSWR